MLFWCFFVGVYSYYFFTLPQITSQTEIIWCHISPVQLLWCRLAELFLSAVKVVSSKSHILVSAPKNQREKPLKQKPALRFNNHAGGNLSEEEEWERSVVEPTQDMTVVVTITIKGHPSVCKVPAKIDAVLPAHVHLWLKVTLSL